MVIHHPFCTKIVLALAVIASAQSSSSGSNSDTLPVQFGSPSDSLPKISHPMPAVDSGFQKSATQNATAQESLLRDSSKASFRLATEPSDGADSMGLTDSVKGEDSALARVRKAKDSYAGKTVIVKGQARHKRKEISTNTLRREEIDKVVATAQDPLRALPTLPGVSTASDLSVRPVVRGGDQAETGVQLDGVPLLMPYHFGSVFSVFHREAIDDFQLYSGVAPAQSEGMLSGTILARSRPAPVDTAFGGLDLSLLRGSGWWGIPLLKDKVGFWISGQSMWYDWTLKRFMDLGVLMGSLSQSDVNDYESKVTLPTTWDVQSGLSFKFNREWLLDLGGFVAGDQYHVLNTVSDCRDSHGNELPCDIFIGPDYQTLKKRCSYHGQEISCPDTLINKTIPDTLAFVGLTNWMARARLSWNPDKDLTLEGVAAYQSLAWDVNFPGGRDVVRDSTNHVWKVTRVDKGELFDWKRSALNLDLTGRKRWSDQHETSLGVGWENGNESIHTDLPRPVAELIQGTSGNPLEVLGIYNQKEVLVLEGQSLPNYSLDMLENLDFRYNSNSSQVKMHTWAEHRWDVDSKTRVRAGLRLSTLPDGSLEIPNPRLQVQRQVTQKDLVGVGLALHTQSELPFEWRLAATTPLVPEKAWLGIVEWEHSFAPGWRSTFSGWGKLYQDLASSSIRHLPLVDSTEYNAQIEDYLRTNPDRINLPDSVRQQIAWWLEPREMAYASTGQGWATGAEASLRYQPTSGWMGWASVEWSMSRRKDRPDGIWYPFGLERPWKLSWVNAFQIDKKWQLSVRYCAMAGNPYTPFEIGSGSSTAKTDSTSPDTALWIGSRNSGRFAPYQRLDLRVSRESTMFGKPATFYYEVWNALNDPNFVLRDDQTGQFRNINMNLPFPVVFLGCEVRF